MTQYTNETSHPIIHRDHKVYPTQGQLCYSGQKWVFWMPIRWVHFFKSSLLPHQWHNFKKWVPNERYGYYLSIDTSWACVGLLVWTPQACKVEHFYANIQKAEKWTLFSSAENLFFAHFFSKCCHSMTDEHFSMKPTANGQKFPKFSVGESKF